MENKICVYAICKNELAHMETWLNNMSEADYIVVLDTGSTDGTYEFLQKDPRVTRVEQKVYNPWRFDTPRNDSMKLCPEDANILVCTDPDELFNPGWAKVLRESWVEGVHKQAQYKYAWNHASDGSPQNIFKYDKITCRDAFDWKYPIHEILIPREPLEVKNICPLDERVYLHHYQDMSKNRTNAIKLLELRLEENPHEPLTWYLLSREYGVIGKDYDTANSVKWYKKSIESFEKALQEPNVLKEKMVCAGCISILGDLYACIKDFPNAFKYYQKLIELDKTYRTPYLGMAEIYNQLGLYQAAAGLVYEAMQTSVQHFDWTETGNIFCEKPYDILSVSYYFMGKYAEAKEMCEKALAFEPNNKRILKNYNAIKIALEKQKYKI